MVVWRVTLKVSAARATIEYDNDNDEHYISVAPASARGLRSPLVRQTWAVMG
jgi:hypothetical protein